MKRLVIFGLTENAQLAFHYFSSEGKYEISAFTVDSEYLTHRQTAGAARGARGRAAHNLPS